MNEYCCEKFHEYIYSLYRYDARHPEKGWQFFRQGWDEEYYDIVQLNYCPFCGKKLGVSK